MMFPPRLSFFLALAWVLPSTVAAFALLVVGAKWTALIRLDAMSGLEQREYRICVFRIVATDTGVSAILAELRFLQ